MGTRAELIGVTRITIGDRAPRARARRHGSEVEPALVQGDVKHLDVELAEGATGGSKGDVELGGGFGRGQACGHRRAREAYYGIVSRHAERPRVGHPVDRQRHCIQDTRLERLPRYEDDGAARSEAAANRRIVRIDDAVFERHSATGERVGSDGRGYVATNLYEDRQAGGHAVTGASLQRIGVLVAAVRAQRNDGAVAGKEDRIRPAGEGISTQDIDAEAGLPAGFDLAIGSEAR